MNDIELGKFISLILRHKPETIGIKIDTNGWVNVNDLINGIKRKGFKIDFQILSNLVENNDKQRFTFNEDKTKIRANQGHSLHVELNLEELTPPVILYHGTSKRFLDKILQEGLTKQGRNHVHLSVDEKTALEVGKRYGIPVLLKIDSKRMSEDGIRFFKSKNNVWLTEYVSTRYFINIDLTDIN